MGVWVGVMYGSVGVLHVWVLCGCLGACDR